MKIGPWLVAPLLVVVPATAAAQSSDPAAARVHLQQGVALAGQGRCNEAIPYFLESIRLDRQPEVLLNLANCEERLGMLGAASTHFFEARDVARGAAPPAGEADPGIGQRIAGFSLMGIGAVGLAIGTIFGLKVVEKNSEIDSICPTGQPCADPSVVEYNQAVADAKIDRAASLVSFGVAAVFVGTGAVLVLTAPKRHPYGTAVWLTPSIGSSQLGAALGGTW